MLQCFQTHSTWDLLIPFAATWVCVLEIKHMFNFYFTQVDLHIVVITHCFMLDLHLPNFSYNSNHTFSWFHKIY